jgi:hypothetical protein
MFITRRKLMRFVPFLAVALNAKGRTESVDSEGARAVLGVKLHDEVSVSLLKTYARSLALDDEEARWQAQIMFHQAQLARRFWGGESYELGHRHLEFLEENEKSCSPIRPEPRGDSRA